MPDNDRRAVSSAPEASKSNSAGAALTVPEQGRYVPPGRPRGVEGDEAYLRSLLLQAETDIAAGR